MALGLGCDHNSSEGSMCLHNTTDYVCISGMDCGDTSS